MLETMKNWIISITKKYLQLFDCPTDWIVLTRIISVE